MTRQMECGRHARARRLGHVLGNALDSTILHFTI